jgi:uncharacterized protein YggU (UPF0235/DUF167 family)
VKLLAHALEVKRADVTIVRGEGGCAKLVAIRGIDGASVRARLATKIAVR